MGKWVLAIDQGTTGTTAMLVNRSMEVCCKSTSEFQQMYPRPGYVEHSGEDIIRSINASVENVLRESGAKRGDISCIGIANQRETTGLFARDGSLLHNFVVWQCKRSQQICDDFRARGYENLVRDRTGLIIDPYFSATKLVWLFQNLEGALGKAKTGDLLFGTIDTFVLHRMTGGLVHATDVTNASRTMLMNLDTLKWDEELLDLFGIPHVCLPEIKPSSAHFGYTKGLGYLEDGIPITGVAGDQQAALFGQACFDDGDAKITLGTGAFILIHSGTKKLSSKHGLLTSVACQIGQEVEYCLEGSAFVAGAAIQWLRDGLCLIEKASDIERLAESVPDSGEVDFVPALSGLGAPCWRPEARGLLTGVSRGTRSGHIARAVLEGIALQNNDIIEAMQKDGVYLKSVKVDGGASANDLLMQYHADYLGLICQRPKCEESTGLGAAALAGLAFGFFPDTNHFKNTWASGKTFKPQIEEEERNRRIARWRRAVVKA